MFPVDRKTYTLILFLLSTVLTRAQVCTGSLGDPVINIDFGSGLSLGSPLGPGVTNYRFNPADCPQDGFYTIINRTTACNNTTWHTVGEDHTPHDNSGYMMLVNASFSPGDFYVDTVKGLCANTTYEFSAWVMNVLRFSACTGNGILPNLSFTIETLAGVKLGTYNSGDIPPTSSPSWKQFGFFITTPDNADVIIRLTNNARGGCGNDLILDDITFSPCGPRITAAIDNSELTKMDICHDNQAAITLNASLSGGYVNPVYQWQLSTDGLRWADLNGANALSYVRNPTVPGSYYYRVSINELVNNALPKCRVASNVLNVVVGTKPVTSVTVKGPVCEGASVQLSATGGSKYEWTGPGGFTASGSDASLFASLQSTGKYYVKVLSTGGCENLDSIFLQASPKPIANAGTDQTICEGKTAALSATPGFTYLWSPAAGLSSATVQNPLASPADTTVYTLKYTDANGCSDTDRVSINVLKKPQADAGQNIRIFEGQSAVLRGQVKGTNIQFNWSPGRFLNNSGLLSPTAQPSESITYTLHVVSNAGCGLAQDDVFVRVLKKVHVPNAFSPNGDGINDVWKIEALETYPEASLSVFNRHGQQVLHLKGYSKPWDGNHNGKPLPAATYYYVIDLKNEIPPLSGWVLIVR